MSKPRFKWWGYVKAVIRSYPVLKKEYNELHEQSLTANITGMPAGGGSGRGTENIALRELQGPKQAEYESVRKAIAVTERMRTGEERLKLIDTVFWKKSHTLSGAAYKLNISYDTAIDYHGDFIMLTAYFRGLIAYEDLKKSQKFALKSQNREV